MLVEESNNVSPKIYTSYVCLQNLSFVSLLQTANEKEEHEFWERVIAHQVRTFAETHRIYFLILMITAKTIMIIRDGRPDYS